MKEPRFSDAVVFLKKFFGEHNQIRLEQIEVGERAAGTLLPWINRLKFVPPLPSVIPYKFENAKGVVQYNWYAVARNERELRDLAEDLTAFVGPTWSTFRGERAKLNASDPIEAAVQDFTNGLAFRFTGNNKKIWESIELMRRVWENRKIRSVEDLRPSGRVLRDFYMALQAGNRDSAELALRELQEKHGYDAINLSFLRVQMLAALERWGELIEFPNVSDVLQVRRPIAVTEALAIAVYRHELLKYEEQRDVVAARDHFRREVLPRYRSLYTARAGMQAPEVPKSFMLLAVSAEPPDLGLRDELIALPGLGQEDRNYLHGIAALLPPTPPAFAQDFLQHAKDLLWSGEYDHAYRMAKDAPASPQRAQILLNCAYELQTLASERAAVEAFNALSSEDQKLLTAKRSNREYLDQIIGHEPNAIAVAQPDTLVSVEPAPDGWLAWLSHLYAEPSWTRAMGVARQGAGEWDINLLLQQPNSINELARQLSSYPSTSETTLHNSLPFFLEFFRRDDQYPRREFVEIYDVLLDVLAISTQGGDDDLTLFNELVMTLLSLGMEKSRYLDVLANVEELWGRYASPSKVDWILDLIDGLVLYPCPAEEKRSELLIFVANRFIQFARRIEQTQWEILELLTRDLNHELLLPLIDEYRAQVNVLAGAPVDVFSNLTGKSIAIYTLTESVAQRVRSIIQEKCAGVAVHLCHDKVGSERLRQLSRGADIFIMATASAKHAATGFIEAHRPDSLPLLRPSGKGSASMLSVLRSHLETAATA